MEIKAITIYDEKLLKEFVKFNTQKGKNYKTKRKVYLITWPIIIFLLICELVFSFFIEAQDPHMQPVIIIMLCLGLFIWIFTAFVLPAISYKNSKKFLGTQNAYIFYDDEFIMTSENPQYQGNAKMKYSLLHKVYETNDHIFLFINAVQAYLVDKSQITNGTAEELGVLISKHLTPKKYIVCNQ